MTVEKKVLKKIEMILLVTCAGWIEQIDDVLLSGKVVDSMSPSQSIVVDLSMSKGGRLKQSPGYESMKVLEVPAQQDCSHLNEMWLLSVD